MHFRPYGLLALFAVACQGEPQPAPVAAPVEVRAPAPAAETLFDGATLANWDGDPRFWRVENGCIVGESTATNPCNATTYLLWRGAALEDFELELDFRLTGGNSGVQFRSEDRGGWQVAGFQADLEDGPNWSGCLYEQDGAGVVATRGEEVLLDGNGVRKERFGDGAKLLELVKPREWNRYRIVARGERVELSINGTLFTSVVDLRPERRLAGLLALQLHAGPPMKAEYRNFELRRLPKADARAVVAPAPKPAVASDGAHRISPSFQGTKPNWIWSSADSPDWDTIVLARSFQLATPPVRTLLRGSADNHVRVFLNGQLALTNDDWAQALEVDVSKLVKDGDNELVALAWNEGGIAAAWFELVAERDGARPLHVLSDGSWTAQRLSIHTDRATWTPAALDRSRFSPAHVVGGFGMAPWGSLSFGSPAQEPTEHALPAEELVLLPGFRAELLYSVPKAQQGSWVSLCEDPAGRFYTSDQYGGLFRITVGAKAADTKVEPVPIELGSAHGLCWAFDSLYAVVSESSGRDNGLYRVRDTNGDDVLDSVQLLRKFEGGGEHGPHAVILGADGSLWIVGGNHTPLPEPIDHYSRPKNWAEDLLEPRIEDPNGHAVGIRAPAGWVVRTDADAKQWDLWACGFRNAYDIALDHEGELFTFDSDMEWDMGAPWYRPTRIFHVVRGADFGWRGGPGKMPPTYPDTWPSVVDIGASSPTGITFGYGAKFPPRYERALFALDWAYGKIYAVHMEPQGSTYTGSFEEFASGRPFPVTDIVIGRDGAMYLTTGGRRTQSGLYRITSIGGSEVDARKEAEMASAQRTTRPSRELRRSLETLLGSQQAASEDVFAALDSADRFTAEAARVALEQRPLEQWSLFRPTTPTGRVQFCVALAHSGGTEARPLLLERLAQLEFAQSDELQRIAVVRANHLATIRLGLTGADADSIAKHFEPHYPSGSAAVDRELLQLLVSLGSPRALVPALDVLESNAAQEERIWTAYCLRVAGAGWTPELRERQFRGLASLLEVAKGGHSLRKYIEEIRRQSAEFLDDDTHALVAPFLEAPKPVVAAAAAKVEPMKFVRNWTRDDLAGFVKEPLVARNFERGRELFTRARCAECHRMAGEGGGTGPDLTGAGSRFSRSDWLDNLLEPSKVISDQYQDTEVLTTDGELYVGRIERDDATGITLRRLPPQEDTLDLAREQIERRRLYPYSRMPAGLLDVLSEDDLRDLAAFVLSGANPASPEFRKP